MGGGGGGRALLWNRCGRAAGPLVEAATSKARDGGDGVFRETADRVQRVRRHHGSGSDVDGGLLKGWHALPRRSLGSVRAGVNEG